MSEEIWRDISWDYVAGLFDGEGNVNLAFGWRQGMNGKHAWPIAKWTISNSNETLIKAVYLFLRENGFERVRFYSHAEKNKRTMHMVRISKWEELEKISKTLVNLTIVKKPALEVMIQICETVLKLRLTMSNDHLVAHLDEKRLLLHSFATKGRDLTPLSTILSNEEE